MSDENKEFERLMNIIRRLRAKDGCPWDREQTHDSLCWNMIEEAYETADAIKSGNMENLCEELGDVMLLVALQAVIAEEAGEFNMGNILKAEGDKMVFRHPHVFSSKTEMVTSEQVLDNWEKLKSTEKKEITAGEGIQRIAKSLPANIRAEKVQKKASKAGMDFAGYEQAREKVYEELNELEEAHKTGSPQDIEEEFGDLMFSVINMSRFLRLNAEISLTNATNKFINRFVSVERIALDGGRSLAQMSAKEQDALWTSIK